MKFRRGPGDRSVFSSHVFVSSTLSFMYCSSVVSGLAPDTRLVLNPFKKSLAVTCDVATHGAVTCDVATCDVATL